MRLDLLYNNVGECRGLSYSVQVCARVLDNRMNTGGLASCWLAVTFIDFINKLFTYYEYIGQSLKCLIATVPNYLFVYGSRSNVYTYEYI